jgi:uncharacterized protein DUF4261
MSRQPTLTRDTTYDVELLYEHAPVLDSAAIVAALRREIPIDLITASDSIIAIAHPDQITHFEEGNLPCITNIVIPDDEVDPEAFASSLQQSWEWSEANSVLVRCRHVVLVTDFTGGGLHYRDRLQRIIKVVAVLADVTQAAACHWRPAGCLVDPKAIREKLAFACNVRQFNADEQGSAVLMDTLGLSALGLVDVQCYFRELDPGRIAPWLFGVAGVVFTRGDIIKDGDTVAGVEPGDKWRCMHRIALVGPERMVIDVEPGRFSPTLRQAQN